MSYLNDAANYVSKDPQLLRKTFIAGLLMIFSMLIIPAIIYQGYLMKILRETKDKNVSTLPEWNDWEQLLYDGILALLFNILLTFPFLIIICSIVFLGSKEIAILIGVLFGIIVSYLIPGFLTFISRDGLSGVTQLHKIKQILFSTEYLIALCLSMVISITIGIVTTIFGVLTLGLGYLITPFIIFPVNCLIMYLTGRAVTDATTNTRTREGTQATIEP